MRRYLGISLDDLGRVIPWRESIDLLHEVRREFGSHTNADLQDFRFAVTYGEFMTGIGVTHGVNANRDIKKHPEPVEILWPWEDKKTKDRREVAELPAAEKARLRALFAAHSGMPKPTQE